MAALYDGNSGVRHDVDVGVDGRALHIVRADGDEERIAADALQLVDRSTGGLTLARPGVDGWRLRIPPPLDPALDALFPKSQGYGRWIDRHGLWPAASAFALISAAVVAIGYFAPFWLAPLVPESVEQAYGEALVGDLGGNYCSTPAGTAALAKLVGKLDTRPGELRVRVVDVPIVNAAALPARHIVLFRPILNSVDGPDELAGVLAHEIAHVRERHVTAALLRQFGVGIFTAMLGGNVGGNIDGLVSLSFTRGAETEADAGAIARLQAANISPAATARFFGKLTKDEGAAGKLPGLVYVSSHPLSAEREKLFREAAVKGRQYAPALSAGEWTALKSICAKPKPR